MQRMATTELLSEESVPTLEQGLDKKQLLHALTSLKKGDFTTRLPLEWVGLDGKIADAFNGVVEKNERLAREFQRMSRVVGKEGKINQRVSLGEVDGSWSEMVDAANTLIADLVWPTSAFQHSGIRSLEFT